VKPDARPLTVLLHGDPRAAQQARLGAALAARGHRVIVCDAPLIAERIRETAPCEELRLPPPQLPEALRRWWTRRRVRELGVDVVHLNFVRPWHVIWSRMRGGPPYVATAWGSDLTDHVFRKTPANRRRIDHVLAHASAVTADSGPLLELARSRGAGADVPARRVLWSADVGVFDRDRAASSRARWIEELELAGARRVLLSPRQTKPHYHVDRILRAFAASRFAEGGVLLIKLYGRPEEDPHRVELERVAADLGVGDRVRFVRPCAYDELPGLYATADAAVSALEHDGVPSTFSELLALGVPLVATDLGSYRDVLVDGERALLVAPGDHDALVSALDRLATDPDLVARLVAGGRAWAKSVDWNGCVDAFEEIYRAACAPTT